MKNRLDYYKAAPKGMQQMLAMEQYFTTSTTIDAKLVELMKLRASQINGCAFCIDNHTKKSFELGEDLQRVLLVSTWEDTLIYTEAEQAALELTEAVTLISDAGVSDALYNKLRTFYDEKEYTDLILIIGQINLWNRMSIAMGNIVE